MNDERDPLDDVRSLWQSLDAPLPSDDLAEADEATRASVAWMRSAWTALEAPPAVVPATLRPQRRPRLVHPAMAAAAAALFIGVALLPWLAKDRAPERSDPSTVAERDVVEHSDQPSNVDPAAIEAVPTDAGLVLRSGSVRLILVQPVVTEVEVPE